MLNLGDEQTSVTPSMSNTQDNVSRTTSEENSRADHLNLLKVGMAPPHLYLSAPE